MNRKNFEARLAAEYAVLFTTEEYAYAAARTTPEDLAAKMTAGLLTKGASKEGLGIKNACKHFGVKHTYTAIHAFLNSV